MIMACASAAVPSDPGGPYQAQVDAGDATSDADGPVPPPLDAVTVDSSPPPLDAPMAGSGSGSGVMAGSCAAAFDGTLATWSFAGDAGSQAATASNSTTAGVVAGAVARSANLKPEAGAGSINSGDWATSSTPDVTKYYTFTVTPPPGCLMDLTLLSVDAKASASGPGSAEVATSADGFATSVPVADRSSGRNAPTLSVASAPGSVELRVYGYSALTTTGTLRLATSMTLTGVLH